MNIKIVDNFMPGHDGSDAELSFQAAGHKAITELATALENGKITEACETKDGHIEIIAFDFIDEFGNLEDVYRLKVQICRIADDTITEVSVL